MKKLTLYNQLFFRLIMILFSIGISFFIYQKGYNYTSAFMLFVTFILLVETYIFGKNTFVFYDRTMQAMLENDFSSNFSKHESYKNYQVLFKLYDTLKAKQYQQFYQDVIYQSILNNIETAILILKKRETVWDVFLMNDYFSKHFLVPKVSKWKYLKKQLPDLCKLIESQQFSEVKTSLQIRVNKENDQTFVMQASRTKTFEQEYYVVMLDSIQKVVEKKEKEAWINLMIVISHELLNSLTPIRSLLQNLNEVVQQDTILDEDLYDMRQSITSMLNRSDHLQQFVESYRKLSMLPTPQKAKTSLQELITNSLQLMAPLFKKDNIKVINSISFNRWLYIDKLQIEQVLINLLTNSIHSLKEQEKKEITITSQIKENRIFITITDTGKGVDKAIEDKIFLPFFTTRKDGTGIGLTLSKNIIEAHGGYLVYHQDQNKTQFIVCLMEFP